LKKNLLLIFLVVFSCSNKLFARFNYHITGSIGLNRFLIGNIPKPISGWGAPVEFMFKEKPFGIGAETSLLYKNIGKTVNALPFQREGYPFDVANIDVNSMFNRYSIYFRYIPPIKYNDRKVEPYISLGIGRILYETYYVYNYPYHSDEDHSGFESLHKSKAFFGLVEFGTLYFLGDKLEFEGSAPFLSFNISVEYGGKVRYFNPEKNDHHFFYPQHGAANGFEYPLINGTPDSKKVQAYHNNHFLITFKVSFGTQFGNHYVRKLPEKRGKQNMWQDRSTIKKRNRR